jgi:RecA-family ATPase
MAENSSPNQASQVNPSIDIMSAFTNDPPDIDFIWPGFVAGTVGALVAPGATGKSFWALEAAMAVASAVTGGDILQLRLVAGEAGHKVVYLAAEDPAPVLIRRIHSIGQHLAQPARESIAANLVIEPVMGKLVDVMQRAYCENLIKFCTGARLLVLDTISRMHRLDENSNGDMARLVSTLEHVAVSTGAAVLFLHHVNKGSARDGQTDQQQAARGASALVDNARWCGYVAKMTAEEAKKYGVGDRKSYYARYGVSKQNYTATPIDQWYERKEGGVLVPVELCEKEEKRYGTPRREA